MNSSKKNQKFTVLKDPVLTQFKTRGIRRKQRRPLSPLWPSSWLPPIHDIKLLNTVSLENFEYQLSSDQDAPAAFNVSFSEQKLQIFDAEHQGLLLSLESQSTWFTAQLHNLNLHEERGFFHIQSKSKGETTRFFNTNAITDIKQTNPNQLQILGSFIEVNKHGKPLTKTETPTFEWTLDLVALNRDYQQRTLSLVFQCPALSIIAEKNHQQLSLALHLGADKNEMIFGMGAQLTWLDLKGKVVPAWVQEPGIGRGLQPLTWLMERFFGAGGSDVQSSAPAPIYMTSSLQAHALENKEFSLFDFTIPHLRIIEVWSTQIKLQVFSGEASPQALLKSLSAFTGHMPPLPKWVHKGAIIGAQGGTDRINNLWQKLTEAGVEVSAFWLQDWVGKRETSVGEQLWWDWKLDAEHYPSWPMLLDELKQKNIRVLGYINPYLVPTEERNTKLSTKKHDTSDSEIDEASLFRIALKNDYLVKDPDQPTQALMVKNTSFSAAIVDLSKPEAFTWLKSIIKTRLIDQGMSGWMADFGEALPVEVELHQGSGLELHNHFPELWARLNREVLDELESPHNKREFLFFNRAGFTHTPKYSHLTWLGDQLTSWKKYDGIYSALVGILSSGLSGTTLSHSDAGGYICTDPPRSRLRLPWISYVRSKELLMRWVEMNAFSAVLRTHEGNQPDRHHQVYDDEESLKHFAKMSQLYKSLAPIRKALNPQLQNGIPLLAHPWIFYPKDPHCLELQEQMMLGPDLMIAPVIRKGWKTVKLYLPEGTWGHWWSSYTITGPEWISAPAPIGQPAAFYRVGSTCETVASAWKTQETL